MRSLEGVLSIAILGGLCLAKMSWATPPSWAKSGTQIRDGDRYTVVCSGSGVAIDMARKEAIRSCNNSAIQQLQRKVSVHSLSIESNSDVAFHQEVTEEGTYANLRCIPKDEAVEESDGSYTVWLKCEYKLNAVVVSHEKKPNKKSSGTSSRPSDLVSVKSKGGFDEARERSISSERKIVRIVSLPQCSDILVRGTKPRPIRCDSNPMVIVLEGGDQELIIRSKGYVPKHVSVSLDDDSDDTIYVHLEEVAP